MTNKQKQHLLAYMGYYESTVDGIWGPLSQQALEAFQQHYDLPVGKFTYDTAQRLLEIVGSGEGADLEPEESTGGDWWEEIEFFTHDEPGIACPCGRCGGFPVEPVERLMRNADAVRRHFGKPMIPSSTVRCDAHNAELPGSAANSLHKRGKAMDFTIPGVSSGTIVAWVKTLPEVHECYPIDGSYVHMGVQKY